MIFLDHGVVLNLFAEEDDRCIYNMGAFLVLGATWLAHATLEGNSEVESMSAFCHVCEIFLLKL